MASRESFETDGEPLGGVRHLNQLRCEVIALFQPKLGSDIADYEDAFAFGPITWQTNGSHVGENTVTIGGECAYAAVADGATESSFSQMWATMLVRAFRKGEMQSVMALRECIERLARRWQHSLSFRHLPWYAAEKAHMGAFSTLLGLTITKPDEMCGRWQALAIGDSCLFHLRADALIESFPIRQSNEFSNSPNLLSSNLAKNVNVWNRVAVISGEWQVGDVFILVTDALAQWLLKECELGNESWHEVLSIARGDYAKETFDAWAANNRAHRAMKNDDVTCVVVRLLG